MQIKLVEKNPSQAEYFFKMAELIFGPGHWTLSYFKNGVMDGLIRFYKWEIDDKVQGIATTCVIDQEAELHMIGILPEYQGQGQGYEFLKNLLESLEKENVKQLFLEVRTSNAAAIKMYKKTGFEKKFVRKNYYSNPTEDAVVLCYDWKG